jgi:quinol-cytochrome oxidoreductase complex cytochrome b subunit
LGLKTAYFTWRDTQIVSRLQTSKKLLGLALFALLFGLLFGSLPVTGVFAAPIPPTATPGALPPDSPLLHQPAIPAHPLLPDQGAVLYWSHCMACHGDQGQGLTEAWRAAGFGADQDCWTSQCHASEGASPQFKFPRQAPPLVGGNALRRYATARDLNQHIQTAMPWWDPNSLAPNDAWALTAYLLRQNGALPAGTEFSIQEDSLAPVHLPLRAAASERAGSYALAGLLACAAAVLVFANRQTLLLSAGARPGFFHHLHPPTIPLPQARWHYTLGAGGLAVFLTLVIALTGVLEMFFYIPTPQEAGLSIQAITYLAPFGGLVRGLHFWAAQALVVVSGVHLARVVLTGAYAPPRRFNFLLGLVLFVVVVLMNFTGYILRWDEGIHWALIVGTNLLKSIPVIGAQLYQFVIGGETPGPATLIRFYAWHIFGLTLAAVLFLAWHIFRVRRDGGIAAPAPDLRSDPRRITRFELVRREVLAMVLAAAALILLAALIPPPLAAPIQDASQPLSLEVRAPWFFLWVQQLLRYGDAFWMGIVLPLGALLALAGLPYLFPAGEKGAWFPRAGRPAQILLIGLALVWLILTLLEFSQ